MTLHRKILIIFSAVLIVLLIIVIYTTSMLNFRSNKKVQLSVTQGQGTREIAQELQQKGLIKSSLVFYAYIYLRHWYLLSGVYAIEPQMSAKDIARLLHNGEVKEYLAVIPEGWRVSQIDEELTKRKIIKAGEFTKIASAGEGYLFPDTYRFPLTVSPLEIKQEMETNFKKKTEGMLITKEIITIASIVEREAKFDEDRPKIAGVYLNRLEKGMRLEADPTIQYGKGSWAPIMRADYQNFASAYNTYLHDGLPPGPICNPGIKSIQAALFPQKDNNYYFFHKSDGHAVYSATVQEHEDNLRKFR